MDESCPFCPHSIKDYIISENKTIIAIYDKYPVTEGHILLVPKRHTENYFTMTAEERDDAAELLCDLQETMRKGDNQITGFNIGANCGETAGQTIMHAHIHLMPRRPGDTENPRGGVRGIIPEKQEY